MNRLIKEFIDSLAKDKLLHFVAGYLIYSFFFFVLYNFTTIDIYACTLWALVPVILIGLGREIWWRNNNLEESVLDFSYTILGAVPIFCIVNYLFS